MIIIIERHSISTQLKVGAEELKKKVLEVDQQYQISATATALTTAATEKAKEIDQQYAISSTLANKSKVRKTNKQKKKTKKKNKQKTKNEQITLVVIPSSEVYLIQLRVHICLMTHRWFSYSLTGAR